MGSPAAKLPPITPAGQAGFRDRPVLLYCRPEGDFSFQDAQLELLRDEYGRSSRVEISSPTAAARRCAAWVSTAHPTFLLLRKNEIVAAALGRLTTRELERIVESVLG